MVGQDNSLIWQILGALKDVGIGLIGGAIGYFLKYNKHKENDPEHKLSFFILFVNIMVGGYASYMFGSLIPADAGYKDFALGAIGVSSYPIMSFIESNGVKVFAKFLSEKTGVEIKDKDEKK